MNKTPRIKKKTRIEKNQEKPTKNRKFGRFRNHNQIERDLHASNAKDRIQFNRNVGGKSFFMLVANFFPSKISIALFSGRTFGMSHFTMRSFEASFKFFGPKIYRVFLGINFERSQIRRPMFCWNSTYFAKKCCPVQKLIFSGRFL